MKTPSVPLFSTVCPSPIGELLLVGHQQALCGCWFANQLDVPSWAEAAPWDHEHPLLQRAVAQLDDYFAHRRRDFDLPLDYSYGTEFQQSVWQALSRIPYGHTVSYGELAHSLGHPRAVRPLGTALGLNPLAIILPCHRVVGADGSLTGYNGGVARKSFLLQLEQPQASLFS